ncbi:hypothetical protein HanIR_Chr08g0367451 [Helianthus annuus]|nr:hypothetical protein HanIR_Chr08g0367451 [Helianthus annuus]
MCMFHSCLNRLPTINVLDRGVPNRNSLPIWNVLVRRSKLIRSGDPSCLGMAFHMTNSFAGVVFSRKPGRKGRRRRQPRRRGRRKRLRRCFRV